MLTDALRSGFGVFVNGQHAIVFPSIAIALSVLSVNFIRAGLPLMATLSGIAGIRAPL